MINQVQIGQRKLEKIKLQKEAEDTINSESKVKFEIKSKTINIPYLNLFQYSRIAQEELKRSHIFEHLSSLLKETQEKMNIDDDSIITFLQLLNNEEVDLKEDEFFNLMKLTNIFKIDSLGEILNNYLRNTKSVDFILNLKIAQEQNENSYLTDQILIDIESCLKDNINECLENDKINSLSVSSVYRMIEKSDPEKISSELLYRYIISSIEERYLLFQFVNIEKLTEESFVDIYHKYQNNKNTPFFTCFSNIEYIKELRDKIKLLEQQNQNLSKINVQLEKQKNEGFLQKDKQISELKEISQINEVKATDELKKKEKEIDELVEANGQLEIQMKSLMEEINNMKKSTQINKKINIFVRTLKDKHLIFTLNDNDRIEQLKELINQRENIPPCKQRLMYHSKQLENGNTLRDYGIGNGSQISITCRLSGDKPVIYVYPDKDDFDVKVKVEMKKEDGIITSRYPLINDNDDNFWIIKANKNGNILYKNRNNNYLFWECLFNKPFNMDEGFVIKGKDCFDFFEEKFDYLGLSNYITADFITYWCPKMEHSNYVLIKFQGDEYNQIAPLIIDPKPDHLVRIFVSFKLLNEKITIPTQNIDKFSIKNKKGFLVFEWGGCLEQT